MEVAAIALLRDSLAVMSTHIAAGGYAIADFEDDLHWSVHAGNLEIIDRHHKPLEAAYWKRHLAALLQHDVVKVIDYIAHTKLLRPSGKPGFVERHYFACNVVGREGELIWLAIDPWQLEREAFAFCVAANPDPAIRKRAPAMRRLCAGKQRLRVFLMRSARMAPARIAQRLAISEHVVNEHLTEIYKILEFGDDKYEQLVQLATAAGLKASAYYLALVRDKSVPAIANDFG